MQATKRPVSFLFAAPLLILAVGGCVGGQSGRTGPTASEGGLQCPVGYTVTCDVRTTGRIHHGTFGKDYDSCSCVSTSQHGETRPVIPRP